MIEFWYGDIKAKRMRLKQLKKALRFEDFLELARDFYIFHFFISFYHLKVLLLFSLNFLFISLFFKPSCFSLSSFDNMLKVFLTMRLIFYDMVIH